MNIVSTKINEKSDDLDFEIVNFPFLDGNVPHSREAWRYLSHFPLWTMGSSQIWLIPFNSSAPVVTIYS